MLCVLLGLHGSTPKTIIIEKTGNLLIGTKLIIPTSKKLKETKINITDDKNIKILILRVS